MHTSRYSNSNLRGSYNVKMMILDNGMIKIKHYHDDILLLRENAVTDYLKYVPMPEFEKDYSNYYEFYDKFMFNYMTLKSISYSCWVQVEFTPVSRRDNLNKSRNDLMNIILNNYDKFNSFITLTFAEPVTRDEALKALDNFNRQMKRAKPDFISIRIDEFTKNGRPHFHMVTNLECGSEFLPKQDKLNLYNASTKKMRSIEYYVLKYWNHGFISAFDISDGSKQIDDNFNIALYMAKYMFKDFDIRHYGKRKYGIVNRKLLNIPKEIKINNEKDTRYKQVLEYLSNIECLERSAKEIKSKSQYGIDFTSLEFKITQEHLDHVKSLVTI